ncbi:MAG: DHHA1 domain protein [Candidatus Woesebacteria bacterium GW2011_GWA1_37_8]|uniref:DHHA1 domain protein n=2 Tax=Candidatus Woeseibacteriota TaxID=1752722 RepID=A0A0G0PBR8_9BACT|nr:MAG: DHHA1 domain protein [Microgenomates group bacterium GW2011_GWC1_37_12b]KKQ46107.1 MAG: DHHA1 domain protein [Candidatus Woesebacteria bacterium GW2011_GWA1_37_8]KKQ86716.1 MAG: DHHA1 domain protein [Candidatus Woesebacteria bacterium GW2011_GWB1_38_8b]
MNYKESKDILDKIKKAKKILLSCHKSPDPDSIASNLAMYQVLTGMKKLIDVISPDTVHSAYNFVPYFDKIIKVDITKFDYSDYDLFIALDSSSYDQLVGIKDLKMPNISMVTIDHHSTNEKYGEINLLEVTSSTCEVLYKVFHDWGIKITKNLATTLLTGIYADSVSFQTDKTYSSTFIVSGELVKLGANTKDIILNLFHSNEYKLLKFWGEMLKNMNIDSEYRFVWTAVPYDKFLEFGKPGEAKSLAASVIFRTVKNTDFGIVIVEQRPNVLNMSLRSRTNFDVSKIAQEFGGSGHKASAGAWFDFENFDEAVEKVLVTARKYAKEYIEESSNKKEL